MYFCRSWFSNMVSLRYVLVFLNFLHNIFSTKFYSVSFLCKHSFLLMRNIRNECWILKVFYVLWNDPETSLLNYVPFVPTCLTCLRATWLKLLRTYVPTCLELLRAYVPAHPHFSRAYMLTCVYIFFMPTCLCALNYFVPTCTHFSRAYVPTTTQKIYWGSFLCLVLLFFLNCLTFYSIQNPKTNSCF